MPDINISKSDTDFQAPEVLILINGKKINASGIDVSELKIELILDGADMFSFTIPKALNNKFEVNYPNALQFGDKVEISLGYGYELFPVMTGIITSLTWSFSEDSYLDLSVEGYDYLFMMMKNEKYRSWNEKSDSDVVYELLKQYPFKNSNIGTTPIVYHQIRQEGESDFNFLKRLAQRNGYEYFAEGETFIFRPPGIEEKEKFSLKLGRDLLEFVPKLNIAQQVSKVRVVGWNPETKKEVIGNAQQEDIKNVEKNGKTGGQTIKSIFKEEVVKEVRTSIQDNEEAKTLAKSILFDIAYSMVEGRCKAIGIPGLRPGQTSKLEGLGSLFSRKYYVHKVTHEIGRNGYYTNFLVKGNTYDDS